MIVERSQKTLQEIDVVFRAPEGNLFRISTKQEARLPQLIQEREFLGDRVVAICDSTQAKEIIDDAQKQPFTSEDLFFKRF